MKAHNVDYGRESYKEGLKFTQDKAIDVSFQHRLWFLKLQGATQSQIQQSLTPQRKVLKQGSFNIKRNQINQPECEVCSPTQFASTPPVQKNIRGHTTLPMRCKTRKVLQESVLSDNSSYLKPRNLQCLLIRRLYHKISINSVKEQEQEQEHLENQRETNQLTFKPTPIFQKRCPCSRNLVRLNHATKKGNFQVLLVNELT